MVSRKVVGVWLGVFFLVANISELSAQKAFSAVWNGKTQKCQKKYGITLPLEEFGIIVNKDGEWWGDEMVIFYEGELGYYPELTPNETTVNGGIPQLADIERHLTKARADINDIIPDKDFDGYAVIDWEEWRPAYNRNWGDKDKYRRWSRDLVKQDHPDWEDDKVEVEARKQFEDASRLLMESTLELAKDMRPKGRWGFYGFPRCYNHGGEAECTNETTKAYNDQLSWLFEASTAIYPSGYITITTINPRHFVYGQNTEALRMRREYSRPEVPVLMYTRYDKDDKKDPDFRGFYNKTDLDASLLLSMDMGLDGVIIWGSGSGADTKAKCEALQKYMREEFGPYIKQKLGYAESCGVDLCNSNGRCVKKDPLSQAVKNSSSYKHYIRPLKPERMLYGGYFPLAKRLYDLPYRTWEKRTHVYKKMRALFQDVFSCQCFTGWTGATCDIPVLKDDFMHFADL